MPPRPLLEIASQPRFIASAMAGMLAFGTMSFIMSASPLAIVGCGFPHAEAHWVIFMHVLGMFVPSFFTGNLIDRFGTTTVMSSGHRADAARCRGGAVGHDENGISGSRSRSTGWGGISCSSAQRRW